MNDTPLARAERAEELVKETIMPDLEWWTPPPCEPCAFCERPATVTLTKETYVCQPCADLCKLETWPAWTKDERIVAA